MRWWKRREDSLEREIQDYLDRQTEDNLANGMTLDAARAAARRKLGPALLVKEDTRAAWGWMWFERLAQDLRQGWRMLAKNPGFTAVAVMSLAVGVGANCAMFSFADALLLRPLPVPRPAEVVTAGSASSMDGGGVLGSDLLASYPDYTDLRDRSHSFTGLAAFATMTAGLADQPEALPRIKVGMVVTGNFFNVMEVTPELGRAFLPEEDQVPGRDPVVVLSHDLWQQEFAEDRGVLGRKVRLSGTEFTVIGVTPSEFTGMDQFVRPAFFVPMMMYPILGGNAEMLESRGRRTLTIKGRLRPGATVAQAHAEVSSIGKDLERFYPATNTNQAMSSVTELEIRKRQDPTDVGLIAMLMTLSAAVLLVACSNVAGLLTSRAPARAREIALRLAIGAGRTRLIRQLITESLLLAVAGAVAGLGVGYAGVMLFRQIKLPTDLPIALTFQMDQRALFFSFAVALLSVLLFGLLPAIQTTKVSLTAAMKASDALPGGVARLWGRHLLVAGQVAVSLALLTLTTSLYRGIQQQLRRGPSFRTDGLLMLSFNPAMVHYNDPQTERFYKELLDRSRSVPGVTSAGLASFVPLMTQGAMDFAEIVPEGYQFPKGKESAELMMSRIDESFFENMGVPIVRGRGFLETDKANTPRVAVINEVVAQRYWAGQDPIGKRFRLDDRNGPWVEIVGIAKTSKYVWIGEQPSEFLYLPYRQRPRPLMTLLVRSTGDPAALAGSLRQVVRGLDSNQPIYNVRTMREVYEIRGVRTLNVLIEVVGAMGLTGTIMALVGLYGLLAYAVSRRTREIGIRMAIGAGTACVLRMVLRQGLVLALYGLSAGLVLSYGAFRLLRTFFSSTTGTDLVMSSVMAPALLAVIMLAAYIPARRASRVAPTIALRYE